MICREFPPYAEDPFWTEGLPEATHQYILQDVTKSACSSSPPISAWGRIARAAREPVPPLQGQNSSCSSLMGGMSLVLHTKQGTTHQASFYLW